MSWVYYLLKVRLNSQVPRACVRAPGYLSDSSTASVTSSSYKRLLMAGERLLTGLPHAGLCLLIPAAWHDVYEVIAHFTFGEQRLFV